MTNHEKHILLWDELSKTGSLKKVKTFDMLFPEARRTHMTAYIDSCWACQTAIECSNCPIKWSGDKVYDSKESPCCNTGSEYVKWHSSENIEERKTLAKIIRDLPWNEKNEKEI